MKWIKSSKEFLNENKIVQIPNIPNTLSFWHGGNLDEYNDIISQKNGRYEYGAGLYLTTNYDTVLKYSKGNRKLYIVTVEKGVDINNALLNINKVISFINTFVITSKRKEIIERIQKYIKDDNLKAYIFNNIILNEKAIKSSNTQYLREFYIDNNIDYEIINNPFGWGEDMMVLYNMEKIVNIIHFKPSDRVENYDLKEINNSSL